MNCEAKFWLLAQLVVAEYSSVPPAVLMADLMDKAPTQDELSACNSAIELERLAKSRIDAIYVQLRG